MLLIGVFFLVFLLASPASAEPVSATILIALAIEVTATSLAITTAILTFVASSVLSFVAQALLKPATASSKASGGSAATTDNRITVRQAVAVRPMIYGQTRVAGTYLFMMSTEHNSLLHLVIAFAGHEIEDYHEIYANDGNPLLFDVNGDAINGPYAGRLRVAKYYGTASQVADANLIRATEGGWTHSDTLTGVAYLYVRLHWNATVFQGGIPNITAVLKGKNDIYDPRTATTGYSSNSALCLANYLCDPVYGVPVDYATGIDETALIAAANACDETVTLADGTTELRYTTDGALLSSAEPQELIGLLLGAMHGRLVYDGETWKIIAGVYQSPTLTFTDDDLRAGPRIQTLTSRRDLFNAIKGTYVGPANFYQKADFIPYEPAAYAVLDGETLWKDAELPLTSSGARAQRIVKIDLQKARQQIVARMPCKLSAWRAMAADTIGWTSSRYGWSAKPFEVASCRFAVEDSPGGPILAVDLELRETDPSVYDWLSSESGSYDPAPNTNFPDARTCLPASNLRVSESLYVARDGGGVKCNVRLAWDASPDAFVVSGGYYAGFWRAVGSTVWTSLGSTTELVIDWPDAPPGLYDFGLTAVNYRGVASATLIVRQSINGLSAAPAAPTGLSVSASGNVLALATWDRSPELDVTEGGQIVFRHSSLVSGATWADSTTIGQSAFPAGGGVAVMPLKSGTYMAKYRDCIGQWSPVASFVQRQHSVLQFTSLGGGTLAEHPGFSGTRTDVTASGGNLMLVGDDDFDSVSDVDALPLFDFAGGVISTGTYAWSAPIDLGAVKRFRLTVTITSQVVDILDDFDSRLGEVDDWASFDGDVTGDEADAVTYARFTDDDPAGTPTWTAWQRIDSAEVEARGVELKTVLMSNDTNCNIHVSALEALAEEVI